METKKMITFTFENNNSYKMTKKEFTTSLKNDVKENGWVDSYYYWKEQIEYYIDSLTELIGEKTDYDFDSYEITNKDEIINEINKVLEKILK
jgi:hypothetical protein